MISGLATVSMFRLEYLYLSIFLFRHKDAAINGH